MNWKRILGGLVVLLGVLLLALNLQWVRVPVAIADHPAVKSLAARPPVARALALLHTGKAYNPVALGLLVAGGGLLVWSFTGRKPAAAPSAASKPIEAPAEKPAPRSPARAPKKRWQLCNVLERRGGARRLWHFRLSGGRPVLEREETVSEGQPLPAGLVARSWSALWQPKLNVAWLPPEKVFLRVLHLPVADNAETQAMVELQLEKISPLPVAHIVWSFHGLSTPGSEQQTVVVLIAPREQVEQFLGTLESDGFLADRLEEPMLDLLQNTPVTAEGAWIFPEETTGQFRALVGWWYQGTWQSLGLVQAPPGAEPGPALCEQLVQMAWAGEMEGWLTATPAWHVVAEGPLAETWQAALSRGLESPVSVVRPLAPAELAAATARRVVRPTAGVALLPPEYLTRYQQQFTDRLWVSGLLAVGGLYLVGVLIYFAALQVLAFQTRSVQRQVATLSNQYTNAIQLRERYEILKDRQELKYAALECYKAVAELLPTGAVLNGLDFKDGRKLDLNGTAPATQVQDIIDFNSEMAKVTVNGLKLFRKVDSLDYRQTPGQGEATVTWRFSCELNRVEVP